MSLEKMIDKTLKEKYDKSDLWDCGYRAGLSQTKVWINHYKKQQMEECAHEK